MNNKQINLKMSDELYNMIVFKARANNMNVSEFIRTSVKKADIKYNDSKDISNLIASLNHIGNNINQIAHILNIANVNNNLSEVDYETIINNLAVITNNISELG